MKRLPIGIQTIRKIINENYIYVDKTKIIYELIKGEYFFLSRPRRFGKSLLISTLKEIFSGNKELFKNQWIYDKIEWEKYPVIHIDFSVITHSEGKENFKDKIIQFLNYTAKDFNITLEKDGLKEKFDELAKKIDEKYGKMVILIDEYDKPIVDYIEDKTRAIDNRDVLSEFYEVIKYIDNHLKFVFITGVSKFSKVSIFSKLNNLVDITLNKDYSKLVGYTQEELEIYFKNYIDELSIVQHLDKEKLLLKIKKWYNGYSWDGINTLYNPFGILNLFFSREFKNYWFQTATPTFLIKVIKASNSSIENFEGYRVGESIFESFDIENIHPVSLLFQTGYLTIKKYCNRRYTMDYPNFEVKESFLIHILSMFSKDQTQDIEPLYLDMVEYLRDEDIDSFKKSLISLFASIPYFLHLEYESYYHSLTYLILALLGANVSLEHATDKGRIDGVLEFESVIYIVEFKLDGAKNAIQQIKGKRYFEKYLNSNKKILLLGIGGFKNKNIEVLCEALL